MKTQECVAVDVRGVPLGYFTATESECLVKASEEHLGWYWSLSRMTAIGKKKFPKAHRCVYWSTTNMTRIRRDR